VLYKDRGGVQSFFDWFQGTVEADKPWLILGKGPSFARRSEYDLSRFHLLSLNHAVREQPVLAAHVIDVDVIEACADVLEHNAQVLIMPWYPHVHNEVGSQSLSEVSAGISVLQRLQQQNRLLWYDLSTSRIRHGSGPVVEATYFSAEAALNLLAEAGVGSVRTLGIDGGSAYSSAFDDLRDTTLLANGRSSFDLQFEGFARTIARTGVDLAPLDRPTPVRVLSAYTPDEALPVTVLQHSIRRRASLTTDAVAIPVGTTGAVPSGQTIILPPRAQVLTDVRKLWAETVSDQDLVIPAGIPTRAGLGLAIAGVGFQELLPTLASIIRKREPVEALGRAGCPYARPALAEAWNPGAYDEQGADTLVLYYPADGFEPWQSRTHPLGHIWVRDLLDGIARKRIEPRLVAEQVALGHVRPSLLYQIEHGLEEPLLLPRKARRLDQDFHSQQGSGTRTGVPWRPVLRAVGRQLGRWTRGLKGGVAAPR
jgi:hypothetical protein